MIKRINLRIVGVSLTVATLLAGSAFMGSTASAAGTAKGKKVQYIAFGLVFLMFFEGMMTLGTAFEFSNYGTFAWIAQLILVTATVTTAIRIAHETED